MRLPRDILSGTYTKPRLFLCETNKEKICQLDTTDTSGSFKFNSMSELSFETARVYNDPISGKTKVNPFYDKIEALRLLYVEDFGYFELQGPELISDGIKESKSCTAYSLEYTLSQKYLDDFYINIGTVESMEVINATSEKDIIPITLYNPANPKLSLLHLALSEVYGWSIGHVDPSLQTLSRQFEIDRESVYDFLMNDVCEKFNCYIVFDTINNTINVYAESLTAKFIADGYNDTFTIYPPFSQIGTVSVNGYKTTKWIYDDKTGTLTLEDVPESGSHIEVVDGALTEWETDVFVSFENLAQEVNINYDADSIKTKLTVTYGDDYDIREVNLGLPYLTDISYYYTVDWMGQDLYDAYTRYMQKSNSLQAEYAENSQEILKWNDYIAYEENRLSLEYSLVESVNSSTVGTYYIRHQNLDGSYYYSEVSLPAEYTAGTDYYSNVTTNVNEEKVSNLYTVLQKYFYAYFNNKTEDITKALDELKELLGFEFMETYTLSNLYDDLKSATSTDAMDTAIYRFLDELWVELGRTPLRELYLKTYKTIQETNIKAGWSNKSDANYGNYYPVTLYISSIESAITERDRTISEYKDKQSVYQNANTDISDSLLMRNNFTEAQLIRLSAFLREDELHLDDMIETDLDDISSSFKIKQDAMESGRIELQKLCQPQLQFSMTMANIYALPEFSPIIHQFQLGKVIRVCLRPDYIKQSRLLQVDINFDDFSDFSCEFGELTSLRTQSDIHADLLSKAITAGKSVATNSSYWTRGSDTATSVDLKIQQGLLDATTQIRAMDGNQGVVIDQYGIHLREVKDNGEIDPKQGWIVNNKFLYSDDGFKSTKSVFGEYKYDDETYYGILAEALVGRLLIGSQIKLENNSGTMTFDDNGLSVTNGVNSFNIDPNATNLLKISNETSDILYVDDTGDLNITGTIVATGGNIGGCEISDGKLQVPTANITGTLTAEQIDVSDVINVGESDITTITEKTIKTTSVVAENLQVNAAKISGQLTADQINTTGLIAENISSAIITGKTINGGSLFIGDKSTDTYAEITSEGYLNATGANIEGTINATDGTIGGCKIADGVLQISNANISEKLTADHINADGISAQNVNLTGTITASRGHIGGWTIIDDWIQSANIHSAPGLLPDGTLDTSHNGFALGSSEKYPIVLARMWYGTNAWEFTEPFNLNWKTGELRISGIINASGGSIGDWTLEKGTTSSGINWSKLTSGTLGQENSVHLYTAFTGAATTIGGHYGSDWRFAIGPHFGVDKYGQMYCSGGTVGGWSITSDALVMEDDYSMITLNAYGIIYYDKAKNIRYPAPWQKIAINNMEE